MKPIVRRCLVGEVGSESKEAMATSAFQRHKQHDMCLDTHRVVYVSGGGGGPHGWPTSATTRAQRASMRSSTLFFPHEMARNCAGEDPPRKVRPAPPASDEGPERPQSRKMRALAALSANTGKMESHSTPSATIWTFKRLVFFLSSRSTCSFLKR